MTTEKEKIILISHSSHDVEYTKAFVDMLDGIGVDEDHIVCSSYPGYGIPLGNKIYDWLAGRFQEYSLHVIFFLSKNYYQSAASLNEMGAAWVMKQQWSGVLLPGFDFNEITGCIDPQQIGIKLDGDKDELKHRLGELKDNIIDELSLKPISQTKWERIRDRFLLTIEHIIADHKEVPEDVVLYDPAPITHADRSSLSIYSCLLLMYAAADNGRIIVSPSLSKTDFQAGKTILQRNQSGRELAHWDSAISQCLGQGYIKSVGKRDPVYQMTEDGYNIADAFKYDNKLDTSKTPSEILALFGEPPVADDN